jgi:hypothetical protein
MQVDKNVIQRVLRDETAFSQMFVIMRRRFGEPARLSPQNEFGD